MSSVIRGDDGFDSDILFTNLRSTSAFEAWTTAWVYSNIPWDTQSIYNSTYFTHDTVTNNDRLYMNIAGYYQINVQVLFQNLGTGGLCLETYVNKNDTTEYGPRCTGYSPSSSGGIHLSNCAIWYPIYFSANEFFTVTTTAAYAGTTSGARVLAASTLSARYLGA